MVSFKETKNKIAKEKFILQTKCFSFIIINCFIAQNYVLKITPNSKFLFFFETFFLKIIYQYQFSFFFLLL